MKQSVLALLLWSSAWLTACARDHKAIVLRPIGPTPLEKQAPTMQGSLVVFSAFDVQANFTATDPERRRHTNYKLFSANGELLQTVNNDTGRMIEGPVEVPLAAGSYKITARANGYGVVTVPVVVVTGRATIVHFEGGFLGPSPKGSVGANLVRLPGGEAVGWEATAPKP